MKNMVRLLVNIFIVSVTIVYVFGMSREQLKKTMTVMKKQCMPKHGVSNELGDKRVHNPPDEKVDKIEQGVFIAEHNVMCYIACIYKVSQVVKNERLNKELISKQVDILYPQELKSSVKKHTAVCVEVQNKYDDPCEGIFYATKCLYEADPPNFIFP